MKIKNIYFLIIGIACIIVSILLNVFASSSFERINNNYKELSKVNKENEKTYLYFDDIMVNYDIYYIVTMDENMYVLKSNINLKKYEFDGKYTRVIGSSHKFNETLRAKIEKIYDDYFEEFDEPDDEELSFDDIFGLYYLEVDKVIDDTSLGNTTSVFSSLLLDIGIVLIVVLILKVLIERKKQML